MRTGRPAKASTIYKVSIHNNGGRRYASTQPYTVDENGKKHYTHKHWGIVDDDMRFHPNSTYFYASLEERRRLIFPSDWDLSEIKALSGRVTGASWSIAAETWTGCTVRRGSWTT